MISLDHTASVGLRVPVTAEANFPWRESLALCLELAGHVRLHAICVPEWRLLCGILILFGVLIY